MGVAVRALHKKPFGTPPTSSSRENHMGHIDLDKLFGFTMSPVELVVRGTLMFWFLFLVFRFILRRDVGSMGISDFLFVVLLGDASQNAMIGDGTSASDGLVLISTLVFWNVLIDWLGFRFPRVERLLGGGKLCLVRDGRKIRRNMRREFISDEELMAKVRGEGLEDLSKVRRMYLESDGEISLIRTPDAPPDPKKLPVPRT
jgi:uncharacterized membrane protein YcaP (DUF421 family)